MTSADMTASIPVMVLDDEHVGMVNLTEQDAGVHGITHISTVQGSLGAPVEGYPDRPAPKAPCLAVTIGVAPKVFDQNLPARIASAASGPVSRWVASNHAAPPEFRSNGVTWTRAEVTTFLDGLTKLR